MFELRIMMLGAILYFYAIRLQSRHSIRCKLYDLSNVHNVTIGFDGVSTVQTVESDRYLCLTVLMVFIFYFEGNRSHPRTVRASDLGPNMLTGVQKII